MFDIGARVVVLASSTKKGFGPKRGSIGYVSSQEQASFIDGINPHNFLSFLSIPTVVAFSRYGFEEKRRCEFRVVVNILPAFISALHSESDRAHKVKDVISLFQSGEFEKNHRWLDWVLSSHKTFNPKLAVLAPVGGLKAENMLNQPMEARAWMESFLRNNMVGNLFRNNRRNNFYPQINEHFMTRVAAAHQSRSATQELLKWAEANPKEAFAYIRALSTMYNLRKSQQELRYFKTSVEGNHYGSDRSPGYGGFNFNAFFNTYILGFFEESKIKEKEAIAEKSKSAQIRNIAKNMRYVRSAMTELVSTTIAKE